MLEISPSNYLTTSAEIRIPFYDLDPGNIVWHGHYFKYFEDVRTLLFEGIRYSYREMSESGFLWPVVDAQVRYVRPLSLDQKARVTATLKEWELRLVVDYEIADVQGMTCTRARTVQVPVNARTHELVFGSPEVLVRNVQERLHALSGGSN
jgi:acyl-CoA thioester hydrolase